MPSMVIFEQAFQSAISILVVAALSNLGGDLSVGVGRREQAHRQSVADSMGSV